MSITSSEWNKQSNYSSSYMNKQYQLRWEERKNPRHEGDGMLINNVDAAERIIRKANEMFPKFNHYYVEITKTNNNENSEG